MSVKNKIFLALSLTFIMLAGVMYLSFSQIILERFTKVEHDSVTKDVERALRSVENFSSEFEIKATDWAKYDDSYNYMQAKNQAYEDSMLNYETLLSFRVRHIMFFDKDWAYYSGVQVEGDSAQVLPLTPPSLALLGPGTDFYKSIKGKDAAHGILQSDTEGILFWVAVSIQDSARTKEANGTMAITMRLDEAIAAKISDQTRLSLEFFTNNRIDTSPYVQQVRALLGSGERNLVRAKDEYNIEAFGVLKDSKGTPTVILRVAEDRPIYSEGKATRNLILFSIIGFGSISIFGFLLLLNKTVLSRILSLSKQVQHVAANRDFQDSVDLPGSDELSKLGHDVNAMLKALEESYHEVAEARSEAERANAAKSVFVAKVSHELRTPLHGILGMLGIVLRSDLPKSTAQSLRMVRDAGEGLLSIINDILDFSKFASGGITLEEIDFSLSHLLRNVVGTLGPKVYERDGIELTLRLAPNIPDWFVGDPLRLKQILINLVGNAIKFTNAGVVKVSIDRDSTDNIVFQISDSGVGIAQDRLDSIFDPFTQADNSAARRYAGTGLGLTIVKQLVEAMGGTISVTSQVGIGTTFSCSFPFRLAKKSIAQSSTNAKPVHGPLLLVSENACIVDYFAQCMRDIGTEIRCTHPSTVVTKGLSGTIFLDFGTVENQRFMELAEQLSKAQGQFRLIGLLTPQQLPLREKLEKLGISNVLLKPLTSFDVTTVLHGEMEDTNALRQTIDARSALGGRELRILIAEDTPLNQIIIKGLLEDGGHNVAIVEDGARLFSDVKASIAAQRRGDAGAPVYDLIITDVHMPQMDGLQATSLIRQEEERLGVASDKRVPIVALTANAFEEEHNRLLKLGIDAVLIKPLFPEELWKALRKLLKDGRISEGMAEADITDSALMRKMMACVSEAFRTVATPSLRNRLIEIQKRNKATSSMKLCSLLLDVKGLLPRIGENVARLNSVFDVYLDTVPKMLDSCENRTDPKLLLEPIHQLKGVLDQAGCLAGALVAAEIYEAIQQQQQEFNIPAHLKELREIADSLSKIIQMVRGETAARTSSITELHA